MNFPINKALLELRYIIPDYLLAVQDNRKGQYLNIAIDNGIIISCRDLSGKQIAIKCDGRGQVTVRTKDKHFFFSLPASDHEMLCFIGRPATTQREFAEMLRKEFDFDIDSVEVDRMGCIFN